ncbi:DNA glycosylase [Aspergillus ambiguus]|uniref:DNA-3-methyladenine glycosylase family protein n=1 Tax=Aspergillus ambiguus TaxID=176160 RepID=UPI003CCD09A6
MPSHLVDFFRSYIPSCIRQTSMAPQRITRSMSASPALPQTKPRAVSMKKSKTTKQKPTTTSAPSTKPETIITTTVTELPSPNHTLDQAYAHLISIDPRMKPLIDKYPCTTFSASSVADVVDPYMALTCSIISQQVSGAAASTIRRRFINIFNPPGLPASVSSTDELSYFPSPQKVAEADIPFLRSAGLSLRKAEYIKGLSEKFASGELSADILINAGYEELVEKLTAVRGIGVWTVEMFACFGLKRWDVFSTGDLAIQRGMAAFIGRNVAQLQRKKGKWRYMTEKEMVEMAAKFAPYRSVFMWYMWRVVEDISVEALQT